MPKTLFTDIEELITNEGVARKGGVRVTREDLGIVNNGSLLLDSTKGILWMGLTGAAPRALAKGAKKVSLKGKTLSPALTDCHTHMVFAGSRHHEFAKRLAGKSYQEIADEGGGIGASVAATRSASESELYKLARERVLTSLRLGVGVIEIKSGYGLDWPTEVKMLKVIAKLKKELKGKVVIQSTFLGAHAFPPEARTDAERGAYVDEVVDKMIPEVARQKLADACDVFFDQGYYNVDQARRVLKTAEAHGLKIKLHADELADTGGASLAAELEAMSADHLLKVNAHGVHQLASRGIVAVLLPATALYLGVSYAPAKHLAEVGVPIALASDFNPGSSPTLHMPFVMSLACMGMGLTMPQAFAAATYGGARALQLQNEYGFLKVGGKPKMAIFNCPSHESLISQLAHPGLCDRVI